MIWQRVLLLVLWTSIVLLAWGLLVIPMILGECLDADIRHQCMADKRFDVLTELAVGLAMYVAGFFFIVRVRR